MATLNMNLSLPTVGATAGPTYATLLNTAFEDVDAHDHTSGKGVQVPTSGLNINADLEFNSNAALELTFVGLESQGSAPSTNLSVYVDSSNDLYYKNSSGTSVQLTNGSVIAASGSGVITYSSITTSPYSVLTSDAQKILGVNTSTAKTLNLPAATNVMWVGIKDVTGSADSNNITIAPNGADTIEGVAGNYTMDETYSSRMLISDGVSAWFII
jgi:hypothetical protein